MQNRIVVRYQDGRLTKGFTTDFMPNKDVFHVTPSDALPGAKTVTVNMLELKAVFFVKDFGGNREYHDKAIVDEHIHGRKIEVIFRDGETIGGKTEGYNPQKLGFFMVPGDPASNNIRVFVVNANTQHVRFM